MKDMKDKQPGELNKLIAESKETLRTIRFGGAGSRERNVKKQHLLRKMIARAMTQLSATTR